MAIFNFQYSIFNICKVVSGQERLVTLALSFEGLQLAGDIDRAVAIIADIKRYDADGVAGYQELVAFLVVEDKGKDAVKLLQHPADLLMSVTTPLSPWRGAGGEASIESQDDLTV